MKLPRTLRQFIIFRSVLNFSLIHTLVPLFIISELGGTAQQFSIVVTVGVIVSLLIDIPSSAHADIHNRKRILYGSLIFGLVGGVLAALSHNFEVFLLASVLVAIQRALYEGVTEAMTYDEINAQKQNSQYHFIMSRYMMYAVLVGSVAALIGGLLAWQFGLRTVFWLTLLPIPLLAILLKRLPEPRRLYEKSSYNTVRHMWHTLGETTHNARLRYYFFFNLALWTYALLFNNYLSLYFTALSANPLLLGAVGGLSGLAIFTGHFLFRNFNATPGRYAWLLLILLILAMAVPWPVVSIGMFLGQAIILGGLTAVFDREKLLAMSDAKRSSTISLFSNSVQVVFVGVSALFSVLLTTHSVQWAYGLVGGCLMVATACLASRQAQRVKKQVVTS